MTFKAVTDDRTRAAHDALNDILVEVSQIRDENVRLRTLAADWKAEAEAQTAIIEQLTAHNRQLLAIVEAFMGVAQQVPQLGLVTFPAPPPPPPPPTGRQLDDPDMGMAHADELRAKIAAGEQLSEGEMATVIARKARDIAERKQRAADQ